jgi:hypothetical protein
MPVPTSSPIPKPPATTLKLEGCVNGRAAVSGSRREHRRQGSDLENHGDTVTTTEITMDEKKKTPGTGRGAGRARGSKNVLTAEVKADIASFFKNLTIESMAWRRNVARHLEGAHDAKEFRFWSTIGLQYAFGTPTKMVPEGTKRESLIFLTTTGLAPWDERADSMKDITDRMLSEKAAEEKVLALEAKKPAGETAAADKDSEAPETLELVEPAPSPEDFTRGRR